MARTSPIDRGRKLSAYILIVFLTASLGIFLSGCSTPKTSSTAQNSTSTLNKPGFFTTLKNKVVNIFTGIGNLEEEKRRSLTAGQRPFVDNEKLNK